MVKQILDAKQVLQDIRSGMNDAALMAKYGLSEAGLESLVRKLVQMGRLREISAGALIRDIRGGMTNRELMKKYQLTRNALEKIFSEINDSGLSVFTGHCGDREKKVVCAERILADIRLGMAEPQLMVKYGLSSRGLQSAFWKMVRAGIVTWEELIVIYPALEDSVAIQRVRRRQRSYPLLSVQIFEFDNPMNNGRLKDVSEGGFGATGLLAAVNQRKTLILVAQESVDLQDVQLQGECRWFHPGRPGQSCAAGFEIVELDEQKLRPLRRMVESMTCTFP